MNIAGKTHPKITPERIAKLSQLAKKIDREERDSIKAKGRAIFARHEAMQKVIGGAQGRPPGSGIIAGRGRRAFGDRKGKPFSSGKRHYSEPDMGYHHPLCRVRWAEVASHYSVTAGSVVHLASCRGACSFFRERRRPRRLLCKCRRGRRRSRKNEHARAVRKIAKSLDCRLENGYTIRMWRRLFMFA